MDCILADAARRAAFEGPQHRRFRVGAAVRRRDGAVVHAHNSSAIGGPCVQAHAECRLVRKLDRSEVVYVARILRDGALATARPCRRCAAALRARGIERAVFTTAAGRRAASSTPRTTTWTSAEQSAVARAAAAVGVVVNLSRDVEPHAWNGEDIAGARRLASDVVHDIAHWMVCAPARRQIHDFGLGCGS